MKKELKERIYKAQCIGNVEPIEYMIPYPSMRSLIEGQNIKFSQQVIFNNPQMTNLQFYEKIHQTAHWLDSIGFKPKDYIKTSDSGTPRIQAFCPECGSHIYATSIDNIGNRIFNIRLGSVVQKDQFQPKKQVWCRSALPWVFNLDNIPRIDKQS